MGNLPRWAAHALRGTQKHRADAPSPIRPAPSRVEFPPAIPRRVASQQSPLPLHRPTPLHIHLDRRATCRSCLRTGVGHVLGTNNNGPAMTGLGSPPVRLDRLAGHRKGTSASAARWVTAFCLWEPHALLPALADRRPDPRHHSHLALHGAHVSVAALSHLSD